MRSTIQKYSTYVEKKPLNDLSTFNRSFNRPATRRPDYDACCYFYCVSISRSPNARISFYVMYIFFFWVTHRITCNMQMHSTHSAERLLLCTSREYFRSVQSRDIIFWLISFVWRTECARTRFHWATRRGLCRERRRLFWRVNPYSDNASYSILGVLSTETYTWLLQHRSSSSSKKKNAKTMTSVVDSSFAVLTCTANSRFFGDAVARFRNSCVYARKSLAKSEIRENNTLQPVRESTDGAPRCSPLSVGKRFEQLSFV